MPATRGEKKRREQYLHSPPAPAMSQSHVSFSVSEPFRNGADTDPIRASAAVRECLDHVSSSVGETINANAVFSVAASALPTGVYGQEAVFTLDPTQRNASGYTVGSIIRAAKEVEETIWNTEEGRLRHRKSIAKVKATYKPKSERDSSGPAAGTAQRDSRSPRGAGNQQKLDETETPSTSHGESSQDGSRRTFDRGTIAPSTMAGWLIREAGYPL